jgi:hypothetical protein
LLLSSSESFGWRGEGRAAVVPVAAVADGSGTGYDSMLKSRQINSKIQWLQRAILLIAVLAFVSTNAPFFSITRWICEGRVCGISVGAVPYCCCASSDSRSRDKECMTRRRPPLTRGDTIACADGCGCKQETIRSGKQAVSDVAKVATPEPAWAVLPVTDPLFTPSFFAALPTIPHSGRGPPAASSVVCTLSPRAPPVA